MSHTTAVGIGVMAMLMAAALVALPGGAVAAPSSSSAAAPASGSGSAPADSAPPRTLAEAEERHAQRLQRCAEHPVAAVRDECRRESGRRLQADRARLTQGDRR